MGHLHKTKGRRNRSGALRDSLPKSGKVAPHEQPDVEPQVLHFMQVPLRTRVKLPQAPQLSPSKPLSRASAARVARDGCAGIRIAASRLATWTLTVFSVASTPARISD